MSWVMMHAAHSAQCKCPALGQGLVARSRAKLVSALACQAGIDKPDVRKLAELAHINVTDEEVGIVEARLRAEPR